MASAAPEPVAPWRVRLALIQRRIDSLVERLRCRECERLRAETVPGTCPNCGRETGDRWHEVNEG